MGGKIKSLTIHRILLRRIFAVSIGKLQLPVSPIC